MLGPAKGRPMPPICTWGLCVWSFFVVGVSGSFQNPNYSKLIPKIDETTAVQAKIRSIGTAEESANQVREETGAVESLVGKSDELLQSEHYVEEAEQEANRFLSQSRVYLQHAEEGHKAAQYAVNAVQPPAEVEAKTELRRKLNDLPNKYADWKFDVLHRLQDEAQAQAVHDAKPYHDAMTSIERRVEGLQQRAEGLSNSAFNLMRTASNFANNAVVNQRAGNAQSAQDGMMAAHQMSMQAIYLGKQGFEMGQKAQIMQGMVPVYEANAEEAWKNAESRVDPKHFAKAPVDPSGWSLPVPLDVGETHVDSLLQAGESMLQALRSG